MHKRGREMTLEEIEKNPRQMTPEEIKKFNEEIELTVYPVENENTNNLDPEEMQILKETMMDDNKDFKIDDDYLKELDDYNFNMKAGRRRRRKTVRRSKKSRVHKKRRTHRKRKAYKKR